MKRILISTRQDLINYTTLVTQGELQADLLLNEIERINSLAWIRVSVLSKTEDDYCIKTRTFPEVKIGLQIKNTVPTWITAFRVETSVDSENPPFLLWTNQPIAVFDTYLYISLDRDPWRELGIDSNSLWMFEKEIAYYA